MEKCWGEVKRDTVKTALSVNVCVCVFHLCLPWALGSLLRSGQREGEPHGYICHRAQQVDFNFPWKLSAVQLSLIVSCDLDKVSHTIWNNLELQRIWFTRYNVTVVMYLLPYWLWLEQEIISSGQINPNWFQRPVRPLHATVVERRHCLRAQLIWFESNVGLNHCLLA